MHPAKAVIVENISRQYLTSPFLILINYTGMNVGHFAELRKRLREAAAECHVVKNSLLRRALQSAGWPDLHDCLNGQNAIVTGQSDICAAAKTLKTFAAEFSKPEIRGGILDRTALSVEQIKMMADLPSKAALQAQLLGLLLAPATRLVRVLNEPAASLARLLKAKAEKEGAPAPES